MKTLKIFTIVIPVIIAALLIQFLGLLKGDYLFYKQLINACLFLFNIFIILSWMSFGVVVSFIYLSVFIVVNLFTSAVARDCFMNLHIIIYTLVLLSAYYYNRRVYIYEGYQVAEIETIEKDINTLIDKNRQLKLQTEAYQKKFSKFAILKDVTESLSSSLSLTEVANLITKNSFNIIAEADICLLFLVNEKRHKLVLASFQKKPEVKDIKVEEPDLFDVRIMNKKEPLLIQDIKKDYRFDYQIIQGKIRPFRSLISTPLISKDRSIGVLRLDSRNQNVFDLEDLRLLNIVADLAAVAIENAKLFEETERLARTDSLTACYVQRYMRQLAEERIAEASESKDKVSFLMIDIDHFKRYNDKYGHIAGDIVLKETSALFRESFPKNAIVCRYGGEEFAVVLPKMTKKEATDLAEEMRKKIEKRVFYLRRQKTQVTISLGVATYNDDADNLEELINKADKALYKAKEKGRNRVCVV